MCFFFVGIKPVRPSHIIAGLWDVEKGVDGIGTTVPGEIDVARVNLCQSGQDSQDGDWPGN